MFIDLNEEWCDPETPVIYIIPSAYVFGFCESWVDNVPMVRFQPYAEDIEQFKENWELLKEALKRK